MPPGFLFASMEATMDGNTMTLATQMAINAVKEKIRFDGRKLRDYAASDLRKLAAVYLKDHPEVLEAAAHRIATNPAFAKFRSDAQRRGR
jgi:hypothetical protein